MCLCWAKRVYWEYERLDDPAESFILRLWWSAWEKSFFFLHIFSFSGIENEERARRTYWAVSGKHILLPNNKKNNKNTHTKQKPTFTRFFFYSICLAVIYRRPLKWDCLRKEAKGTFQYTSKESVIKKNKKQTQPRASPVTLCSLLQLYSSFKNHLFPVNISHIQVALTAGVKVRGGSSRHGSPLGTRHFISSAWCHTVASLL